MDKKNIKKHLTSTFLSEDKKPVGLTSTEKIQADSKKSNNANQKEVAKEMEGYEKSLEKETEPVKYENGEKEEEFQDLASYNQGSIINLKPDNDPGEAWVEKNKQAITGKKSTQGNSTEYANVIPEDQAGFTGPDFNDNLYKNNVKFNDKVEKSRKAQDARIGVNVNSDTNDNYLKENKKSKMKRLVFKKEFKGVGNALNLIPETYKVDGKEFHMTDGNEKYEIRWEGSLTEGRAIVLKASDKNLMNEDMENMKRLMGYKSQDTLGTVKGADRIDENKKFNDIWGKTKNLMTEMTGGYGFTGEGNLEGMKEYDMSEDSDSILTKHLSDFYNRIGKQKGDSLTPEEKKEEEKVYSNYFNSKHDHPEDFMEGKDFPDLTGDGKVTQADILKGRGVELDEGNSDGAYYTAYKTDGDIGLDNFGSYFEVISSEEVDEYQDNGWSIEGPMSEDEAMLKQAQHNDDQRLFKYLNTLDDRDVERDEMNYNRGGKTPSHISAIDQYHADKKDRAQKISKRKLRGGDDW